MEPPLAVATGGEFLSRVPSVLQVLKGQPHGFVYVKSWGLLFPEEASYAVAWE
ncbi:hypothetical protein COCNU_16G006690 [Cocos nucifera]|uniref:Uncharacterized protein n=1 Tax=Cocos nucifera TaxID=13894 RepID=A0A8K0IYL9_COCNU|nr:hypothetical protein COCNU_16G006690 [Cocos nucifera]